MFLTIDDFVATWTPESEATSKVLAGLNDSALVQRIDPDYRSLGELAWHLVTVMPDMLGQAGLSVLGPSTDTPPPNIRAIAHEYKRLASSIPGCVRAKWNDQNLGGSIAMYGQQWPRRQVLARLVLHQVHHRGQMIVLMRQAGLKVPAIYGPVKEDSAAPSDAAAPSGAAPTGGAGSKGKESKP